MEHGIEYVTEEKVWSVSSRWSSSSIGMKCVDGGGSFVTSHTDHTEKMDKEKADGGEAKCLDGQHRVVQPSTYF